MATKRSVLYDAQAWSQGRNGSDVVTAAGSDPDVREAYMAIEALEDGTEITVNYTDLEGVVREDQARTGDTGKFWYGYMTELRVTAGSVEAYRIFPFNTFA